MRKKRRSAASAAAHGKRGRRPHMQPAHLTQFETPKGVTLNGYLLGTKKPSVAIVWVHGLGSSMFSKREIAAMLAKGSTSVLLFSNRGHDKVAYTSAAKKSVKGGAAHEVFTDCVDDIQGAVNFAKKCGPKSIFIVGHSTGCQKSVYYASKKPRGISGYILLAPMSDYAAERKERGVAKLKRAERVARAYVRSGRKHELLPERVWGWPWIADAQRFLSLYTGEGEEEIFSYWNAARAPKALESVRAPLMVVLAEKDEYADRSAKRIADWFAEHIKIGDRIDILGKATHSFRGHESELARKIADFVQKSR